MVNSRMRERTGRKVDALSTELDRIRAEKTESGFAWSLRSLIGAAGDVALEAAEQALDEKTGEQVAKSSQLAVGNLLEAYKALTGVEYRLMSDVYRELLSLRALLDEEGER